MNESKNLLRITAANRAAQDIMEDEGEFIDDVFANNSQEERGLLENDFVMIAGYNAVDAKVAAQNVFDEEY